MAVRTLPMYDLHKAVGPKKPNLPDDVRLVQSLFKAIQGFNDVMLEGVPAVLVNGVYSAAVGDAILTYQKKGKQFGGRNVVDGVIDPLPSRSGLAGDWDRDFRCGVASTLVVMCYRLFRFNPDSYFKLGETLNLKWVPDPFDLNS